MPCHISVYEGGRLKNEGTIWWPVSKSSEWSYPKRILRSHIYPVQHIFWKTKWPKNIILDVLHWHTRYISSSVQGNERGKLAAASERHSLYDPLYWCFAYDWQNHARYLLIYYAQMTSPPNDQPTPLGKSQLIKQLKRLWTRTHKSLA